MPDNAQWLTNYRQELGSIRRHYIDQIKNLAVGESINVPEIAQDIAQNTCRRMYPAQKWQRRRMQSYMTKNQNYNARMFRFTRIG